MQCCESSSEERSAGNPHATICGNRRWATASGDPVAGAKFPRATHLVVSIAARQMYMWRAVDSEGEVLEILLQPQRDKAAAVRLLRKLLRRQGFVPAVIVTDKLRSYGAALREIGSSGLHEQRCAPTIARRIRISRFDDANERCKASNQANQLSALFPSTRPLTTRPTCNGI